MIYKCYNPIYFNIARGKHITSMHYADHYRTAFRKDNITGHILAYIIQPTERITECTGRFIGDPVYIELNDTVICNSWSLKLESDADFRILRENLKTEYMLQCLQ
jgi:hypothetical protein